MDLVNYLKVQTDLNLKEIAFKMWPKHKSANTYLSTKLNGGRPFTDKDKKKLRKILKELGLELIELSKSKD